MNRVTKAVFCFIILTSLLVTMPAGAITIQNSGDFELVVSGPVSMKPGTLILNVTIKNNAFVNIFCASINAVVIDPWTGTRITGPIKVDVNKMLSAKSWDDVNYTYIEGGSATQNVTVVIPAAIKGVTTINKTLAIMIYSLDDTSAVRGGTGWGLVVTP